MMRNAFAARTDTTATWAVLQKDCLLVQEDEERERRAREGSALGRRMRAAHAVEDQPEEDAVGEKVEPLAEVPEKGVVIPGPTIVAPVQAEPEQDSTFYDTASIPERDRSKTSEQPLHIKPEPLTTQPLATSKTTQPLADGEELHYWLTVDSSQRHITLPRTGELILGRFDPSLEDPLDVDLTYEDQSAMTVSRRHARITSINGQLRIEDLRSSNGLFLNGRRIKPGEARPFKLGDRITLGALELNCEPPAQLYADTHSLLDDQLRFYLFFSHTGRKEMIHPPEIITLGRSDPSTNIQPTIDLSQYGEVATYVSRCHAVITWGDHNPFLRDTNSTYGTRLNGEQLPPHRATALKPGDHISLGGCVLAYDIEL
jgi:pSer/pThr/pTyr-binding forkhead associated (FHA) protein